MLYYSRLPLGLATEQQGIAMIETLTSLDERLDHALQRSPYLIGRKLRFEADQGHVVLRGVVRSFFQKQMAQEAIRNLDGVRRIDNQLEVTD